MTLVARAGGWSLRQGHRLRQSAELQHRQAKSEDRGPERQFRSGCPTDAIRCQGAQCSVLYQETGGQPWGSRYMNGCGRGGLQRVHQGFSDIELMPAWKRDAHVAGGRLVLLLLHPSPIGLPVVAGVPGDAVCLCVDTEALHESQSFLRKLTNTWTNIDK